MRVSDRDLIRGEHYGQRSCEPHSKAEHMAAPTKVCDVKILLANSEPSTHGRFCCRSRLSFSTNSDSVAATLTSAGANDDGAARSGPRAVSLLLQSRGGRS